MSPRDEDLLLRWSGGDARAGNALVARHFASVYRFVRAKLDEGVDNLVQQTFLGLVEGASRVRDATSFKAYLFGIARRQLLLFWRKQRRASKVFSPGRSFGDLARGRAGHVAQPRGGASIDSSARGRVVAGAAHRLPDRRRAVLLGEHGRARDRRGRRGALGHGEESLGPRSRATGSGAPRRTRRRATGRRAASCGPRGRARRSLAGAREPGSPAQRRIRGTATVGTGYLPKCRASPHFHPPPPQRPGPRANRRSDSVQRVLARGRSGWKWGRATAIRPTRARATRA